MTLKPKNAPESSTVIYCKDRWRMLEEYRKKALLITNVLKSHNLLAVTHGSVARGDVSSKSDVDIFIPEVQNSFLVESALEKVRIAINNRFLVQATPNYAMKAHIIVDAQTTVTFPLMEMRRVEREFYRFGGELTLFQLETNVRVAGVDKRLMLIEPTVLGHIETSVVGHEEVVAKSLGISPETILDRVHALCRRAVVGRTGVFVKKELEPDETFELALKKISDSNPAVRRRIKG